YDQTDQRSAGVGADSTRQEHYRHPEIHVPEVLPAHDERVFAQVEKDRDHKEANCSERAAFRKSRVTADHPQFAAVTTTAEHDLHAEGQNVDGEGEQINLQKRFNLHE